MRWDWSQCLITCWSKGTSLCFCMLMLSEKFLEAFETHLGMNWGISQSLRKAIVGVLSNPPVGFTTLLGKWQNMDVSENSGTPKSSILVGFSIINHPFLGIPIFGNTHMWNLFVKVFLARKAPDVAILQITGTVSFAGWLQELGDEWWGDLSQFLECTHIYIYKY